MSRFKHHRVVITGFGLVSPIGNDAEALWQSLTEGKSGIRPLESLPTASLKVKSGAEVRDFTGAVEDYGPLDKPLQRAIKKNMKVMCREIEMGVAAAQKALNHSGLGEDRKPDRCGCIFGCDYILTRPEEYEDGLRSCRDQAGGSFELGDWPTHGLAKVNPLWLLKYLPNMPNSHVSIYNDFRGPNNALTVREASMNLSLAEAASVIDRGAADVMLVGATGSRIQPLRTMHAVLTDRLAGERPTPSEMSRPFDDSCDGMVLGEGAGALMLESLEHAQARGARIWGEIIGHGAAMVGPKFAERDYLRESLRNAMQATLRSCGPSLPSEWHLHAHGQSSPLADVSESLAIGDVLAASGNPAAPVVAAKSYFGNLGAGSAAVEIIASLLALERGRLFPIRNLQRPIASAAWSKASTQTPAGQGFIHNSFTSQGQAACIAVASL